MSRSFVVVGSVLMLCATLTACGGGEPLDRNGPSSSTGNATGTPTASTGSSTGGSSGGATSGSTSSGTTGGATSGASSGGTSTGGTGGSSTTGGSSSGGTTGGTSTGGTSGGGTTGGSTSGTSTGGSTSGGATGGSSTGGTTGSTTGGTGATIPPKIGHVFILILENEDYSNTFSSNTLAPYLATTLSSEGALLKNYYGTGHNSLDNYISMISGQAANADTQADCQIYMDFMGSAPMAALGGQAVGQGCVFPASVPNVADQLTAAKLSWKGYMEDMGNTPSRESATCGHPALNSQDGTQSATAADNYATRHDPFMYFHSIIDDAASCSAHVVALTKNLDADLAAVNTTANFTFITPSLCHDGHDSPCADGEPGGLASINDFLKVWVPKIQASPAFKQDGLLIITFDESNGSTSDSTGCCLAATTVPPNTPEAGEAGPGGGVVGAVLLSPYIKPGTVSTSSYNHFSMLRTVEDVFGLQYLGYAGDSAQASFGADVFTEQMPEFPAKQ